VALIFDNPNRLSNGEVPRSEKRNSKKRIEKIPTRVK
jgi:hypothetical protein